MAEKGAQPGNNNAAKGADWRDAIRYELAKIGRELDGDDPAYVKGLRKCAEEFIKADKTGEPWALRELGDRMDDKSKQSTELTGSGGEPLDMKWTVELIEPDAENPGSGQV